MLPWHCVRKLRIWRNDRGGRLDEKLLLLAHKTGRISISNGSAIVALASLSVSHTICMQMHAGPLESQETMASLDLDALTNRVHIHSDLQTTSQIPRTLDILHGDR